jgi:CheY-like chemotaxis protein
MHAQLANNREVHRGVIPGLHILLVEDHFDTAAALAQVLAVMGHTVIVASTVSSALAAAASEHFELVVSDIGLPDGTGHELMRELVGRYNLRGVAVSGYGMEEDRRRSLAAGFSRHLTKPISVHELRDALEAIAGEG